MTKLPKPACPKSGTRQPSNLYTEEQMLQFRRDALEDAVSICFEAEDSDDEYVSTRHTIARAISKLKETNVLTF
jgi:hypothetical protein